MRKTSLFAAVYFVLVASFLVACQQKSDFPASNTTSEPLSSAGQEELDHLNAWDVRAVAIVECPIDYPGYIDTGETRGWIELRKSHLSKLGVSVRWNCEMKVYEIVPKGEAALSLCGCPPIKID